MVDRFVRAPKVLLHDHLDGGLRPSTVIELADAIGWRLPDTDPRALQAWFTRGADTRDILQYLATFEHTLAVMQTADALERVAAEAAVDLAADGVVYAEVRFAPELHQEQGLALEAVCDAVVAGFRRGEAEVRAAGGAITVNAIVCAMRTSQRSLEVVRMLTTRREREPKLVGFDLAGAETGFPPSLHAEALAVARHQQIAITIHASEPPDLELISGALEQGADRVGHGVRLQRDVTPGPDGLVLGRLAQYVLDRQVHLEMAPTCHVQVGAVPTIEAHPIAAFLRHGFNVGVNTDNRLMSGVMPSSELRTVATTFDLGIEECAQLVRNAAMASFAPYADRVQLVREVIDPGFAALG
jgi:adenosine deaminase